MDARTLAATLEDFLANSTNAIVVEDGEVLFELATTRYSIAGGDRNKCHIHLWSEERNTVRQVVEIEHRNGTLRLKVQQFGRRQPHILEIFPSGDRRTASGKKGGRAAYQRIFERALLRHFPLHKIAKLGSTMDLEHSISPVYARALLRHGKSSLTALGIGRDETQASIDASLTFGLLWLEHCRKQEALRGVVEGLHLFVPPGTSSVIRARAAHLDHRAAKFRICELDEASGDVTEFDLDGLVNLETRLVRCVDEGRARERFTSAIARMRAMVPECASVVLSPAEISFRWRGLEFARARIVHTGGLRSSEEIVFGAGANQTVLDESTEGQFRELTRRLTASRRAENPLQKRDALWRMSPERWLESAVLGDITSLDSHFDAAHVYSQVPAFAAGDRAMIDVLAATRERRLAVIELKASEDMHLVLQGLDYWARVHWHHQRKEFAKFGYFDGRELSPDSPLLVLVAPALQVHPATDTLLRYLSPKIDFVLLGVDERWRDGVRVVF